jgi:hypothetical protein
MSCGNAAVSVTACELMWKILMRALSGQFMSVAAPGRRAPQALALLHVAVEPATALNCEF